MAYIVKTRACLKYRLLKECDRGRLLDVSYVARRIGKTELLVEIARDLDCIIIERDKRLADYFQREYPDVKFMSPDIRALIPMKNINLLLDEGIDYKLEREILKRFKHCLVGGYSGCAKNGYTYIEEGKVRLVGYMG